jgi:hypothetical protein
LTKKSESARVREVTNDVEDEGDILDWNSMGETVTCHPRATPSSWVASIVGSATDSERLDNGPL